MLIGILFTHRKAPVKVREEVFKILEEKIKEEKPYVKEKAFIVTCYRVETYLFIEKNKEEKVINELIPKHLIPYAEIITSPSSLFEHLVLVCTGADSPAIGEPEVQGQVKKGFMEAKRKGWIGKYLGKFFEKAISVSKKIREEIEIDKGSLSIPKIVCMYIKEIKEKINDLNILLVGTGEMGIAISRYFVKEKIPFKIATRNKERKEFLEKHAKLDVILYNEKTIPFIIKEFDIVIFVTNPERPLINLENFKDNKRTKIIIDLGFPENVSKDILKVKDIIYHGIDEFKKIIEERIKEKEAMADYVKLRAKREGKEFEKWILKEEKVLEVIKFVDNKIEEIIKKNGNDYNKIKKFLIYPILKSIRSSKPVEEFIDKWLKK